MDTAQFMARSIARILFRSFFLSPTLVGPVETKDPPEESPRLWICRLACVADLALLYGFLPGPPRPVLPRTWPTRPVLRWAARELESILFDATASSAPGLGPDALHLCRHTLRSQKDLLLPLGWPGAQDESAGPLAEEVLGLVAECDARLVTLRIEGTEELPPEGPWIPKHRPIRLIAEAVCEGPPKAADLVAALRKRT